MEDDLVDAIIRNILCKSVSSYDYDAPSKDRHLSQKNFILIYVDTDHYGVHV